MSLLETSLYVPPQIFILCTFQNMPKVLEKKRRYTAEEAATTLADLVADSESEDDLLDSESDDGWGDGGTEDENTSQLDVEEIELAYGGGDDHNRDGGGGEENDSDSGGGDPVDGGGGGGAEPEECYASDTDQLQMSRVASGDMAAEEIGDDGWGDDEDDDGQQGRDRDNGGGGNPTT